jgi:membrane protease YdiL (CAAX protease family)
VDFFFDDHQNLRAGWRIAVFLAMLVAAYFVVGSIALLVGADALSGGGWGALFVPLSLELAAVVLATAVATAATERRSLGDVGFGLHAGWFRHAMYGLAFGSALLATAALPVALFGATDVEAQSPSTGFVAAFAFFAIAAAHEELLCRGFVFQALVSGLGARWATILTSAVFAALHMRNPNFSGLAMATTFAAGVLFAIAYLRTRSLWLATGAHLGWNFSMGSILGMPVSGLRFFGEAAPLHTTIGEPMWLTGGPYGPEAGAAALVVVSAGCALLARIPLPGAKSDHGRPVAMR